MHDIEITGGEDSIHQLAWASGGLSVHEHFREAQLPSAALGEQLERYPC